MSPRILGFVTNNRFLSVTVEVDDLKKVSNSLSALLSEKQKQEKVSGLIFLLHTFYFPVDGAVYLKSDIQYILYTVYLKAAIKKVNV